VPLLLTALRPITVQDKERNYNFFFKTRQFSYGAAVFLSHRLLYFPGELQFFVESRIYSQYVAEEIRSRLRSESFVFQVAIQTFKDQAIKKYNFTCCFVWV